VKFILSNKWESTRIGDLWGNSCKLHVSVLYIRHTLSDDRFLRIDEKEWYFIYESRAEACWCNHWRFMLVQ